MTQKTASKSFAAAKDASSAATSDSVGSIRASTSFANSSFATRPDAAECGTTTHIHLLVLQDSSEEEHYGKEPAE